MKYEDIRVPKPPEEYNPEDGVIDTFIEDNFQTGHYLLQTVPYKYYFNLPPKPKRMEYMPRQLCPKIQKWKRECYNIWKTTYKAQEVKDKLLKEKNQAKIVQLA